MLEVNTNIGYISNKKTVETVSRQQMNPYAPQQSDAPGMNFYNIISERYNLKQLQVKDINRSYSSLVIAGAKETFSDYELFLIDQYLMSGRNLIIFQDGLINDPNQSPQPGMPPRALIPVNNGLNKLLSFYGVNVKPAIVMDKNSYVSRGNSPSGGIQEQKIYFAPIIESKFINQESIVLKKLKEISSFKEFPFRN